MCKVCHRHERRQPGWAWIVCYLPRVISCHEGGVMSRHESSLFNRKVRLAGALSFDFTDSLSSMEMRPQGSSTGKLPLSTV